MFRNLLNTHMVYVVKVKDNDSYARIHKDIFQFNDVIYIYLLFQKPENYCSPNKFRQDAAVA